MTLTERKSGSQRHQLLSGLGLFVLSVLLFLPSLSGQFLNWDDVRYVHDCGWLLNLSLQNIGATFTTPYFSNYHPLTMISFMVDFHLYGGYHAWGFRLTNILLHAASVVVLFAILIRAGAILWLAFLTALLFAVHPLRLESVVWISERKDVLCGLFFLWAFLEWTRAEGSRAKEGRARWHLAFSTGLFALALLSKAMAITFPVIVILYDLLHQRDRMRGRLPLYAGLLSLAVIFAILNRQAQTVAVVESAPIDYRFWTAMYAPLHYTLKTLWPSGLVALYPFESNPSVQWPVRLLALLFNLGAIALVIRCWKRAPSISFGLLASAVVLGPVSGIVMFGSAYAADRYSYLPTAFLLIGIVPWLSVLLAETSLAVRRSTGFAIVTAVAMCVAVSLWLMPTWHSSEALWSRVLAIYPDSSKARVNLAHAQLAKGPVASDTEEVVAEPMAAEAGAGQPKSFNEDKGLEIAAYAALIAGDAERARQLSDGLTDAEMRARLRLAIARHQGDREGVAAAGRDLLLLDDPYEANVTFSRAGMSLAWAGEEEMSEEALDRVRIPTRETAGAWGQLARMALEREEWELAENRARRALAIFPGDHNGAGVLSEVFLHHNDQRQAEKVLERARRHPVATIYTRVYAEITLAALQAAGGNTSEAERMVQEALRLGREGELTAESWNFIGWTAENRNQPGLALRIYREALQVEPTHPAAAGNAAFLLMRRGALEEAVQILKRASEAHPEDPVLRSNLARVSQMLAAGGEAIKGDATGDAPAADVPPSQPTHSE